MREAKGNPNREPWLRLIGWFKIVKGVLLLITVLGLVSLLHRDVATVIEKWIRTLRFDPENKFAHALLAKVGPWDDHSREIVGAGTLAYAALFLTEGIGLLLRERWAEYLTAIATGSFIPFELYILFHEATVMKGLLLAVNVAIVWYLIARLKRSRAAAPS
jgi:uncharacterized membrane protein (DUF2068 family)